MLSSRNSENIQDNQDHEIKKVRVLRFRLTTSLWWMEEIQNDVYEEVVESNDNHSARTIRAPLNELPGSAMER